MAPVARLRPSLVYGPGDHLAAPLHRRREGHARASGHRRRPDVTQPIRVEDAVPSPWVPARGLLTPAVSGVASALSCLHARGARRPAAPSRSLPRRATKRPGPCDLRLLSRAGAFTRRSPPGRSFHEWPGAWMAAPTGAG